MLVRIRAAGVQHQAGDGRIADGRTRPEVRREEADGALEIRGVQEERPAVVAGRDVLAFGLRLRLRKRHRQIAVAEELTVDALLEIESVEREKQPRRKLRDAVKAPRIIPAAASVSRTVGDVVKVHAHAAHDELGRLGREMRVAPPAETTFDIVIKVLGFLALILRVHPRAEEAGLEAMARVLLQQRPSRGVDRETGVIAVRHPLGRDEEVAGHLDLFRGGGKRRRHQAGDQQSGGAHGGKLTALRAACPPETIGGWRLGVRSHPDLVVRLSLGERPTKVDRPYPTQRRNVRDSSSPTANRQPLTPSASAP